MGSDDLYNKRKVERQRRVSKKINERAETWLVVCEGEKTEPNYFKRLFEYANSKSDRKIKFYIDGEGRNTESLVNSIDNYFGYCDNLVKNRDIPYGKIFAVFDKDSFKKGQFNNAIHTAIKRGYIPIWSNECIELWFLLHFDYMKTNITRDRYYEILSDKFSAKYKKPDEHFDMLDSEKRLGTAIRNAKKLYCQFEDEPSFAKSAPCTTVFVLIEELEKYLGIKLT